MLLGVRACYILSAHHDHARARPSEILFRVFGLHARAYDNILIVIVCALQFKLNSNWIHISLCASRMLVTLIAAILDWILLTARETYSCRCHGV